VGRGVDPVAGGRQRSRDGAAARDGALACAAAGRHRHRAHRLHHGEKRPFELAARCARAATHDGFATSGQGRRSGENAMNGNEEYKRPEEIERDLEQTRAEVSSTLDAIQEKLTPGQLMDQAIDYWRRS